CSRPFASWAATSSSSASRMAKATSSAEAAARSIASSGSTSSWTGFRGSSSQAARMRPELSRILAVPLSSGLRGRRDQVRQEMRRVRRAEAGDRIPAGGSAVTGNARRLVVAGGHVEEVGCVLGRVTRDLVERRVDVAEVASLHLVGYRDQAGPLRGAGARAADDVPAGAARVRAAATGVPSGDG